MFLEKYYTKPSKCSVHKKLGLFSICPINAKIYSLDLAFFNLISHAAIAFEFSDSGPNKQL